MSKRRMEKARAYHRKWCWRRKTWDGAIVWCFALNPGAQVLRWTEYAVKSA